MGGGRIGMNGPLSQSNYVRGNTKFGIKTEEKADSDSEMVAVPPENDADPLDFESEKGDNPYLSERGRRKTK